MQPAASREEEKHGGIKTSKAEVRVGIGSHNPRPPPLLTAAQHTVRIPDASLPRQALFMPLNSRKHGTSITRDKSGELTNV